MQIEKVHKESFCVIGKAGATWDGAGFVQKLWQEANSHFGEVADLAAKDANGNMLGFWGVMTDVNRKFLPWEDDFSKGLYMAGVEVRDDVSAPAGWEKWTVPAFEYLRVKVEEPDTFVKMIRYMNENGIALVGAVQDFTDPATQQSYMLFPISGD